MTDLCGHIRVSVALVACALTTGALAAEWVNPPLPQPAAPPARPSSPETSSNSALAEGSSRLPASKQPRHLRPSRSEVKTPTPVLAAASATAPAASPLVARAGDFINAYWNNVAGSEADVLVYLNSSYSARLNYYGRAETKEAVLADKASFMKRWPIRRSWSQGGESPKIACNDVSAECAISGERIFDNASPERGARADGMFRYSYTVSFRNGAPQIVGEDSDVVARR
jgi:hypothetical protein